MGKTEELASQLPPPKYDNIKILEVRELGMPHPYCITPKHLMVGRMYLDADAIREAEEKYKAVCDICKKRVKKGLQDKILKYDEHKTQTVLFLEISNDKTKHPLNDVPGLHKYLLKIKPKLQELKIDGVAFIRKEKK